MVGLGKNKPQGGGRDPVKNDFLRLAAAADRFEDGARITSLPDQSHAFAVPKMAFEMLGLARNDIGAMLATHDVSSAAVGSWMNAA